MPLRGSCGSSRRHSLWITLWTNRGARHDRVAAGRQPGRDRPPDHPDRPAAGHPDRRGATPRPTPTCRSSPRPTRRCCIGPANPARVVPQRRGDPGRGQVDRRRRRSTPATASCPRTPSSPAPSQAAGLVWVGPGADAITAMGDKINARNLMAAAGVPVAPGTTDPAADVDAAAGRGGRAIGYPVMVKAAAGGGGMGMAVAADEAGAAHRVREGARRSPSGCSATARCCSSGTSRRVRHVEVQILGLADGRVVALGERECSVQRRNQKLVEESPVAGASTPELRARAAGRRGAGRRGGRLPQRRHGRVPARPGHRRLLLPGDEHPAAGRAPGHRGCLRHRPGRGAAAGRRRPGADVRPGRAGAARARHRAADQRRGPEAVPARPGRDHHLGRADRRGRPGRRRLRRRHHRDAALRLADGQADRARRRPRTRRSTGPGRRSPASRSPARRTTCRSSPSCSTTPSSSPATTTPASSSRMR